MRGRRRKGEKWEGKGKERERREGEYDLTNDFFFTVFFSVSFLKFLNGDAQAQRLRQVLIKG